MRAVTATEKLRAVNEGTMTEKEFTRQMRQQFPMHITQFNGFTDSVQILKNRGVLFEAKKVETTKVYDERPPLTYSLDALDRGIRVELGTMGVKPGQEYIKAEDLKKATEKAKGNLEKNATHYLDLLSGESNKVDKHDKMKNTKRGAKEVDTFNAMKKATLKEGYTEKQIEAAVQRIKERKAGEHEDGTPKSNDEMGDDEREDFYNNLDSVEEIEKVDIVKEAGKTALIQTMNNAISAIRGKYGEMPGIAGIIRDFLKTHIDDLATGADPLDEFKNYVDANYDALSEKKGRDEVNEYTDYEPGTIAPADLYYSDKHGKLVALDDVDDKYWDNLEDWLVVKKGDEVPDPMDENKGKDYDGDGDIDGDDYMAAKDKAIKGAMSKDSQLKEAVKTLIRKALTEESLNEAATGNLSKFSDDYADFAGMTQIINQLENLVTEVEGFYAKTGEKLQKIFDGIGNVTNEEGLKVGGFIAPAIESAFKRDIQPVVKRGFMNAVQIPTIKQISSADIDAHNSGERPLGEEEVEEKQTMFTPVMESKKK